MTNKGVAGYPSPASAPPGGWGYLRSGSYYWTSAGSAAGSTTLGTGTLRVSPWVVPNACVLTRIGASVTIVGDVGSKYRLGIFADDGTGYPGSLVLDAGTIAGDSATVQEITMSLAVTPGLYWVGGVTQVVATTQPTITTAAAAPTIAANMSISTSTPTAASTVYGFLQSSITAALPGVFTPTINASGAVPRVFVKIA